MGDFTPGPWFSVNDGSADEPMMNVKAARTAGREPGHVVAIVATGDSPQAMETANARLIAAAPDLFAALERLLMEYEYGEWQSGVEDMARAALAKATGAALTQLNEQGERG